MSVPSPQQQCLREEAAPCGTRPGAAIPLMWRRAVCRRLKAITAYSPHVSACMAVARDDPLCSAAHCSNKGQDSGQLAQFTQTFPASVAPLLRRVTIGEPIMAVDEAVVGMTMKNFVFDALWKFHN